MPTVMWLIDRARFACGAPSSCKRYVYMQEVRRSPGRSRPPSTKRLIIRSEVDINVPHARRRPYSLLQIALRRRHVTSHRTIPACCGRIRFGVRGVMGFCWALLALSAQAAAGCRVSAPTADCKLCCSVPRWCETVVRVVPVRYGFRALTPDVRCTYCSDGSACSIYYRGLCCTCVLNRYLDVYNNVCSLRSHVTDPYRARHAVVLLDATGTALTCDARTVATPTVR